MAPRLRVPAHVFGYSIAIMPAVGYAIYWKRNHQTDEEIEKVLGENYTKNIQGSREKKQDMVKFFAAMKDPTANREQEMKMREVLYGGKGEKKRHYAVDESLYGTEEGLEQRKLAEQQNENKKKSKKKKRRRKRKVVKGEEKVDAKQVVKAEEGENSGGVALFALEKKSVAAVGALGVLALATMLIGNKRS
eukprot:scaffold187_cov266-Chaetoceros_neogracile.AAC.50